MMQPGFHYEQTTDSVGRFRFELLPPGEYSARVTAHGMSPQLSQNLHVNVGGAAEIEFKLAIAGVRESVTVSAEPRLVETQPRGLLGNAAQFKFGTKHIGINYFPASYQVPTNFVPATNAHAPRQVQFALRLGF